MIADARLGTATSLTASQVATFSINQSTKGRCPCSWAGAERRQAGRPPYTKPYIRLIHTQNVTLDFEFLILGLVTLKNLVRTKILKKCLRCEESHSNAKTKKT